MDHVATSFSAKLTEKEKYTIQQFESLYNEIDNYLRKMTGKEKKVPFFCVVNEYFGKRNPLSKEETILRNVGDLRNCIVHGKTKPYEYCAIPTEVIVEEMERILKRLKDPTLVIPKFQKKVERVGVTDSIAHVLKRINEYDFSQFPVYDDKGFKGLLTENGLTRWLAFHVVNKLSLVDLTEVTVKEALKEEEKRKNWAFMGKDKTVGELKENFSKNTFLEAVLITETGKQTESLIGIATRWDILTVQ